MFQTATPSVYHDVYSRLPVIFGSWIVKSPGPGGGNWCVLGSLSVASSTGFALSEMS